jgi:hypothetical protein
MKKLTLILLPVICLVGCKLFGSNPTPPSKVEQAVFTVLTNYVVKEYPVTNVVTTYTSVPYLVKLTNSETVWTTNVVVTSITNLVSATVTNEAYTYTPKDSSKATASVIGGLSNLASPGIDSMVTSGILAVLGLWAQLRSTKRQALSITLAQELETVREFIKTLPQGTKYDDAITSFLQTHQVEAGLATQVIDILNNELDAPQAKEAAAAIKTKVG